MAEAPSAPQTPSKADEVVLEGGTYEIIRNRLNVQAAELRTRLEKLNAARKDVFGSITTALIATERVTTENNCVPRDIVCLGKNKFLFGYNVFFGLKSETKLADVFGIYEFKEDRTFSALPLDLINNEQFEADFKGLYKYYKNTFFTKFMTIGPNLYMKFMVGASVDDFKAFKWTLKDGALTYLGNRFDHEVKYPSQHEFEWKRAHREQHRKGKHPHISIEDRVFVETVGGDLDIKIEDNTNVGKGIYTEPVEHKDQTLDDAEIFYAIVGNLILLKIRPYQEDKFRYLVFNDKLKEVRRIDAIEDSCVLLPDDQGIIFSNGYYLQLGEFKQFPSSLSKMLFERRIKAPNGEDVLHTFYNRQDGVYMLMPYNLIEQKVEAPIVCNGFTTFENGELILFKASDEPLKHHVIQVWQTPYLDNNLPVPERKDSYLFKLGNPAIVRCMSECHEVLTLLNKEDSYAGLYVDMVKTVNDLLDTYFWLDHAEAFELKTTLQAVKDAASGAIDEYEKVVRIKRNTKSEVERVSTTAAALISEVEAGLFQEIGEFVDKLARLRGLRGETISLRDLRYVDKALVAALEQKISEHTEKLSAKCVEFLLKKESLDPYRAKVKGHEEGVGHLTKVADAKVLEEQIAATGRELEMLIEIVSNLKIDDATQTTQIIDGISAIYAPLNQIKVALKKRRSELQAVEGSAQFASQMRLLDQSVVNYLEICDTPARCDEYLTKIMVQVEELEGRFADFEEFQAQITEKRDELYSAFENRKLALVEARNKRAGSLMSSADRILKGIKNRVEAMKSINDINGYFASDLMVDKVRDIVRQLTELEDTVKSGDIQSRLKTIREDAVRQLKDKQDLYVDGKNIIQFGKHKFNVNTQPLELTVVQRDDAMFYHLTGTNFFEKVTDPEFLGTRDAWEQEIVSESPTVYRGEYLAYEFLKALAANANGLSVDAFLKLNAEEQLAQVQQFMAPRYAEGYVKGIHDADGVLLLRELARMHASIGLLRYHTHSRACATVFWRDQAAKNPFLAAKLEGFRLRNQLFPGREKPDTYIAELQSLIRQFNETSGLFPVEQAQEAGEYLFHDLTTHEHFVTSIEASTIHQGFQVFLRQKHAFTKFENAVKSVSEDTRSAFQLVREWVDGFLSVAEPKPNAEYRDEAASLILRGNFEHRSVIDVSVNAHIPKLSGAHAVITPEGYALNYNAFMAKLQAHERVTVPRFQHFHALKAKLVEAKREDMRLEEFQPKVLTSFVRNKLIDSVYLPLIGDNLAKQMGVAGANTRTDRMGMLLLISPPGYGKTTLMEYIASRLGIVFMKINGPAIGHAVTSIDPAEAKNASAREELEKLNLALEMGDNVMLYLDDIQHCNPELLQKFISLCDGQRRIEGVYQGKAKTYDLRGKRVAVVMAGNPYTESGDKFKIPDMLANRADTYNLGDIIGGSEDAFKLSYIENALTSNRVLNQLASRSQKDVYAIAKIAETDSREGVTFEGNYSVEEINEMVNVTRKLIRIRDIVLRVNVEYIASAAQAEAFRTEPPFKLQGSYRNMNRLAEKVLPIMNDGEIWTLIQDHYRNEAQTLTTGAEANLLKFAEIQKVITPEQLARWDEIKRTFKRNQLFHGTSESDPVSRVVVQLSTFTEGLESIKRVLAEGIEAQKHTKPSNDTEKLVSSIVAQLNAFGQNLEGIKGVLAEGVKAAESGKVAKTSPVLEQVSKQVNQFNDTLAAIQGAIAEHLKHQREMTTFRLIDPSQPSDIQMTSISSETLKKIWEIIEAEKKWREGGNKPSGEVPPKLPDA